MSLLKQELKVLEAIKEIKLSFQSIRKMKLIEVSDLYNKFILCANAFHIARSTMKSFNRINFLNKTLRPIDFTKLVGTENVKKFYRSKKEADRIKNFYMLLINELLELNKIIENNKLGIIKINNTLNFDIPEQVTEQVFGMLINASSNERLLIKYIFDKLDQKYDINDFSVFDDVNNPSDEDHLRFIFEEYGELETEEDKTKAINLLHSINSIAEILFLFKTYSVAVTNTIDELNKAKQPPSRLPKKYTKFHY